VRALRQRFGRVLSSIQLENQPRRDLANPWSRTAKGSSRSDLSENWTIEICSIVPGASCRLSKLRVVQSVKVLHAKFQAHAFADGRSFSNGKIEVRQPGPAQRVAMQAISTILGIVHRIKGWETWVGRSAVKVGAVLERNIGEAVGIGIKVVGHGSAGDLASAGRGNGVPNFIKIVR